jgi:hypothetical protein
MFEGRIVPMSESLFSSAETQNHRDTASGESSGTIYRVVFEGTKSPIETLESFAIKYGILTSTPVTKIKFMLRDPPATILETKNGAKARKVLEFIEEAGGSGRIDDFSLEENHDSEIAMEDVAVPASCAKNCPNCGFPTKEGDKFCEFCHTPFVVAKTHKLKTIVIAGGDGHLVDPRRLLIYVLLVLLALVFGILTS